MILIRTFLSWFSLPSKRIFLKSSHRVFGMCLLLPFRSLAFSEGSPTLISRLLSPLNIPISTCLATFFISLHEPIFTLYSPLNAVRWSWSTLASRSRTIRWRSNMAAYRNSFPFDVIDQVALLSQKLSIIQFQQAAQADVSFRLPTHDVHACSL